MKSRFKSIHCLVGLLAAGAATATHAATDGTLGATSTGSVAINASVPSRVRLSGLSDVTLANVDPGVDATDAQNVCVWSNTSTKGYRVTASGSGAASAFTLASGTATIGYSVEWSGTTGQTTGTALTAASPLTGLTSTATHSTCSSGPSASASLIVKIAAADLQTMEAATNYTGTLTLVVAPE